jgi:hypothetical protein
MKGPTLTICVVVATVSLFSSASYSCSNPADVKASLLPDRPKGDFKIIAKVEVVELLKPIMASGYGDASFYAKAKVLETESGPQIGQVIQISIEASSCDVPVRLGQIGYVASNSVANKDGVVSLSLIAPRYRITTAR